MATKSVTCSVCQGTGMMFDPNMAGRKSECTNCGGGGQVKIDTTVQDAVRGVFSNVVAGVQKLFE